MAVLLFAGLIAAGDYGNKKTRKQHGFAEEGEDFHCGILDGLGVHILPGGI
jgi:hypothetical protein